MLFCKINSGRLFSSTVSLAATFQTAVDMEIFFRRRNVLFVLPDSLENVLGLEITVLAELQKYANPDCCHPHSLSQRMAISRLPSLPTKNSLRLNGFKSAKKPQKICERQSLSPQPRGINYIRKILAISSNNLALYEI